MKCKKCGKKLHRNEKFCTICGYYNEDNTGLDQEDFEEEDYNLLEEEEKEEKQSEEQVPEINIGKIEDKKVINYDFEEERDIEAYIGEDYKIIKKSPFNIWAFLLNWMYVLYRKLYVTGVIGLAIALIITLYYTKYLLFYLIGSMILLGFAFNPYYIFIIKNRIKSLERKYEGSDHFTFTGICQEKGGVNTPIALVIYFLFLIVIFFSLVKVNYNNNHNTKYWKENSENKANCTSYVKMANSDVERENYGQTQEALCKITTITTKEYTIYIKVKSNNEILYFYYETENQRLKYVNSTKDIKALEEKQKKEKLTEEEKEKLENIKNIESNYKTIVNNSKSEDEAIKLKKNNKEKVNFVFSREEVIR